MIIFDTFNLNKCVLVEPYLTKGLEAKCFNTTSLCYN